MADVSKFEVNLYELTRDRVDRTIDLDPDLTDQGQSQTVREILKRFSRNEIESENSRTPVKGEYAAEFADDEPLESDMVQTLLDMPDISGMDEMEIMDFISDNTEVTTREKLFSKNSDDPPKKERESSSVSSSEPTPSE